MGFGTSWNRRRNLNGHAASPPEEEKVEDPRLGHHVDRSHSQQILVVRPVGGRSRAEHRGAKNGGQIVE